MDVQIYRLFCNNLWLRCKEYQPTNFSVWKIQIRHILNTSACVPHLKQIVVDYILIIVQRRATQNSLFIILQVLYTCFGCQPHPSSWIYKTITTASGTGHIFVQLPPSIAATLEGGSCTKIWSVTVAVVTVLCTPDDGCGWHPKHVEWTCRITNRLFCAASRWTIINIEQRCTEP